MKPIASCRYADCRPAARSHGYGPGRRLLAAALLMLGWQAGARAEIGEHEVQWHGFAGQALVSTSHNNFFGHTDGRLSSEYTELGGNVSWRANSDWLLSAQALGRRAGASDKGSTKLDYAFARYTAYSSDSTQWSLVAGKAKLPYGLYNETRDTPAARPSILLPQSIYLDRLRDSFQSAKGVQTQVDHLYNNGSITGRLAVFQTDPSGSNSVLGLLGTGRPGDFKGRQSWSSQVLYQSSNEHLRAGLTRAYIHLKYDPNGDVLRAGDIQFAPTILSLQWQEERWSLTAEYLTRKMNFSNYGPALRDMNVPGTSYYVEGLWRFSPAWEGLLRYDVYRMNSDDPDGNDFQRSTGKPGWTRYAKDWTVGARYRFAPGWHLAGELHSVDGTGWITTADNLNPASSARYWNLWMLQLAYQF